MPTPTHTHTHTHTNTNKCLGYVTKLYLIARLQSWSFEECRVTFLCHYSQVHSDPECWDPIYESNRNHYHHLVMPPAQISLTLSHHSSLFFIASDRSSGLYPVSSQSRCMYVRAGRPALARPFPGVHRRTSLMGSSLLLQQCPACLVRLTNSSCDGS